MTTQVPELSVAVIGLGSRGLGVLERIVTLAKLAGPAAGPVRVEVIDPQCDGAGVHATAQPDYLLLNTTCAQVSLFPDAHTVGEDVDAPGPNLYDWVTERGLRLGADGFTVGAAGRAIRPTDFLPRRVLGQYLGWFLAEVLSRAPRHVRVRLHRADAIDLTPEPDGGFTVRLSDGGQVQVGYAFLTTGYTANSRAGAVADSGEGPGLIRQPYPLPECTEVVAPGQTVAINGFGLSAMDVMSCLTVGRGGRFVQHGGELRYEPSGREPTLLLYSRSGVPCRARPLVVEFGPAYQPLVFTTDAVDALRAGGQLDFERDVLPLVFTEMRVAYRRCQARLAGPQAERALAAELDAARGPEELGARLDELDRSHGPFDARATFDGTGQMLLDDSGAYQKWLADVLSQDLAEGVLGFAGSPLKAGLDIMRELRETFRRAVDFGGLTPSALEDFHRRVVPAVNRAVVGPQFERHAELLALLAAGVAHAPFGPAPAVTRSAGGRWTISSTQLAIAHTREADWLLAAHVDLPAVASSASPLLEALHQAGRARPHLPGSRHVPGIDLTAGQHPLDRHGRPDDRVWVLGPLCEGATFYNNLVPSPGAYSRPIFDAHRCVAAMYTHARGAARGL